MVCAPNLPCAPQFVYDEHGHLIGEYDFFGRPLQETVYLGDLPIAVLTQSISTDESGAVQVDNSDSGKVTVVGFWASASTPTGFVGANYQTHEPSSGFDSFTWKLTLPSVGKYFIQARWPSDTGRATHAVFTASANGGFDTGVATRTLNQQQNSNTWVDVGVKTLGVANSTLTVKLTTTATGTHGRRRCGPSAALHGHRHLCSLRLQRPSEHATGHYPVKRQPDRLALGSVRPLWLHATQ